MSFIGIFLTVSVLSLIAAIFTLYRISKTFGGSDEN